MISNSFYLIEIYYFPYERTFKLLCINFIFIFKFIVLLYINLEIHFEVISWSLEEIPQSTISTEFHIPAPPLKDTAESRWPKDRAPSTRSLPALTCHSGPPPRPGRTCGPGWLHRWRCWKAGVPAGRPLGKRAWCTCGAAPCTWTAWGAGPDSWAAFWPSS